MSRAAPIALAAALLPGVAHADVAEDVTSATIASSVGYVGYDVDRDMDVIASFELRAVIRETWAVEIEQPVLEPNPVTSDREGGFRNLRVGASGVAQWKKVDLAGTVSLILPTAAGDVDEVETGGRLELGAAHRPVDSDFTAAVDVRIGLDDERLALGISRRDYVDLAATAIVCFTTGCDVNTSLRAGVVQSYGDAATMNAHATFTLAVPVGPAVFGLQLASSSLGENAYSALLSVAYTIGTPPTLGARVRNPLD